MFSLQGPSPLPAWGRVTQNRVCVAPPSPSSPAWPSFIQLSGPFSGSVVQTQGFASGRSGPGSPRARAHPHSHSRRQRAHTNPQRRGTAIPWDPWHVTRIFEIAQTRKQREKLFQSLSKLVLLISPPNQLASNHNHQVHARSKDWAGLAIPPPGLDSARAGLQASPRPLSPPPLPNPRRLQFLVTSCVHFTFGGKNREGGRR